MKKTYVLIAAATLAAAACTKSDTLPADSLSLSASQAVPLDSMTAAERAAQVAPGAAAPAAMVTTRRRSSSSSAGSGRAPTNSGTSMSGTSTGSSGSTASSGTHTVKNTNRDAVIGGAAGAVIGGATHGVKGAVVGGTVGAVLGGVIGNNVDVKKKKN